MVVCLAVLEMANEMFHGMVDHALGVAGAIGFIPGAAADAAAAGDINASRQQTTLPRAVLNTGLIPIFRSNQNDEIAYFSAGARWRHHEISFGCRDLHSISFWCPFAADHAIGRAIDAALFGVAAFNATDIGYAT